MDILCFGEIMLRLSPPNGLRLVQTPTFEATYGGSEANVAVSLAQLGLSAAYTTRVPDNELGRAALGAVARYGVDVRRSIFGGERLGVYFLEMGAGLRGSRVLYDRQGSGMAQLAPGMVDWRKTLENASWLHWSGITPALSHSAAEATLEALRVADDLHIRVSCDLNYRDKLWKYGKSPRDIMPKLVEYTDVLLGDRTAFDICLGIPEEPDDAALLQSVARHFPRLRCVAMSSRQGNTASHNHYRGLLFDGQQCYASRAYEMPDMLDRIGGGDAFMAGLIFGLRQALYDPQETIEFAVASAALKHYVRGDFNLSTESEVRALMAGNTGGKVSR
jgi:2-dehydro-3-deoxygluconokinase